MKGSSHTTLTTGNIGIPKFDLTGKIALITGVGSEIGIGRAIARTFAWYGADLVIADIDEEKIKARAGEIAEESGRRIVPVCCDVCSNEDQENLVKIAMESFGRIDILVNDAGVVLSNDQLIVDTDEDEFDRVVDTDFKAVFFLCKRVAKIMIEQEQGNIINLATRCMAFEWSRFNIRANCICPGYIDTNMTQSTLNKEKAYEAITRPIPHNRKVGDPMDIAATALFLACDCSDMVNGFPLYTDGARSIW